MRPSTKFTSPRYPFDLFLTQLPVLAIMNGTFFTSAASLFLNARFPIITESTSLRFHSAQLGFFPDAGATKLLSSLGGLGMYLGLSGAELSGHSLVHFGLSPWFIEAEALEAFINDMSQNASRNLETLQERLAQNAMPLQPLENEAMGRDAARLGRRSLQRGDAALQPLLLPGPVASRPAQATRNGRIGVRADRVTRAHRGDFGVLDDGGGARGR